MGFSGRRRVVVVGVVGAVMAALCSGATLTASADPGTSDTTVVARDPIVFGTAAPTKANLLEQEAIAGRHIAAVRIYRSWGETLFGPDQVWERDTYHTLFLSIKTRRPGGTPIMWADIAAANPGDPLYSDMQDMAAQIRDFGDRVYLTLSHEPEQSGTTFGSPADFAAAFRNFVTVMRAERVGNMQPTAIFTGYGFTRHDERNVANYYPGDSYVSVVGVDLYNWGSCRSRPWTDLSKSLESARVWGLSHPSVSLMITEWGSVEDPNDLSAKAQWITDSAKLLESPGYEQFAGLFAWGALNDHTDCPFGYDTSPQAQAAWAAVGQDPLYDAWE